MTSRQGNYARLFALATAVIAVDQVTKQLALDNLRTDSISLIQGVLALRLTFNPGGAFGILSGVPWLFLIAGFAISAVIIVWAGRLEEPGLIVPLGLVLGGGLGNLIDRVFRGFDGMVVDFIELSFWPTFNVADMAISLGVVFIAIGGLKRSPDRAET